MPREVNPSHVKAARLRERGVEWTAALKESEVPDNDLARKSVRRVLRKLVSTAKAEAQSERDAADAEVRAKRKDLKAREAVLKLAERKAIPKRCFDRSVKPGCGPSSSGASSSSSTTTTKFVNSQKPSETSEVDFLHPLFFFLKSISIWVLLRGKVGAPRVF